MQGHGSVCRSHKDCLCSHDPHHFLPLKFRGLIWGEAITAHGALGRQQVFGGFLEALGLALIQVGKFWNNRALNGQELGSEASRCSWPQPAPRSKGGRRGTEKVDLRSLGGPQVGREAPGP